ncbi:MULTISPECIES: GNAT family N-acetyltransferase [unclassified Planococcus (in: firmicutes)]|uniref:GNAT family N-acetyltransferase n=1 Tax=unclassified Planococcus (in: firmicutes) TaxID=2662419 RepID=UPI000C33F24F|nr:MULTISPECIES: GNAT family N-acetyltransferase [unclassified Planococcus (in: firmicutes)]AUD14530.1 GNAT family N-acetyltransferase [Planococcus sp. MB-3u-03]PKG44813.1 GNAT family N-acetyltransferase [Planococcus sp. Urea-trap-24]PKG87155.1 GNAT family N-acetyltransferase [Planococcus sp. Urea-3u-39]PKH40259.1 GNAT family N-acetyltransferase [Planococcus sp. MB-3u-09]
MASLRKCTTNDLQELQDISILTYKETFDEHNSEENMNAYLEAAYNKPKLERELATPSSHFYFAMVDNEVAGYLKINTDEAQTEPMGSEALEVERIYIKKKFQKNGAGKVLMNQAFEMAERLGKNKIWLGVWEHNNNARAFYEKKGFVETGSHSFFMGDDEQTDLILTKTL